MKVKTSFSQNLLFWSFFVPVCAAPAFYMASGHAVEYGLNISHSFLGMAFGAAIYIFLFAAIYTFAPESGNWHTFLRAIRWAVKIRACVSLLSFLPPFSFLMIPDLYAGMLATSSTGSIGSRAMGAFFGSGDTYGFFCTALTTLFGGFYVFLTILFITPAVYAFVLGCFRPMTLCQPSLE